MQIKCTIKGYVALLIGFAAAAFHLIVGPTQPAAVGQDSGRPPQARAFDPSERIDVEQVVDFPYDI